MLDLSKVSTLLQTIPNPTAFAASGELQKQSASNALNKRDEVKSSLLEGVYNAGSIVSNESAVQLEAAQKQAKEVQSSFDKSETYLNEFILNHFKVLIQNLFASTTLRDGSTIPLFVALAIGGNGGEGDIITFIRNTRDNLVRQKAKNENDVNNHNEQTLLKYKEYVEKRQSYLDAEEAHKKELEYQLGIAVSNEKRRLVLEKSTVPFDEVLFTKDYQRTQQQYQFPESHKREWSEADWMNKYGKTYVYSENLDSYITKLSNLLAQFGDSSQFKDMIKTTNVMTAVVV